MTFLIWTYFVVAGLILVCSVGCYFSDISTIKAGKEEKRHPTYHYVTGYTPIDKERYLKSLKTYRAVGFTSPVWPLYLVFLLIRAFVRANKVEKTLKKEVAEEEYKKAIKYFEENYNV